MPKVDAYLSEIDKLESDFNIFSPFPITSTDSLITNSITFNYTHFILHTLLFPLSFFELSDKKDLNKSGQ